MLETTRLVSLISSGVNCISETSSDKGEDTFFSQWIDLTNFDKLVEHTLKFVKSYPVSSIYDTGKATPYFEDTFELRVASIFEKIIESIESNYKPDFKQNVPEY